ncbi:MAG: hypothetical protein PHQ72_12635 [Hespellia sp.]|nr:hypothetical protein [Hespellia sp.]
MKQGLYMKCMIMFCVLAVVIYTAAAVIFQYQTGQELSTQLTLGWFSFFGVELINMAYLKKEKIRKLESEGTYNENSGN